MLQRKWTSQNAYSKIENNITQLTVHHVKELSKILEVSITELWKGDFEIHKPYTIAKIVTKMELAQAIGNLQEKLPSKHTSKHDSYLVAMSLVLAAGSSLDNVH